MKKYLIGSAIVLSLAISAAVAPKANALTSAEAEAIISALSLDATKAAAIRALVTGSATVATPSASFTRDLTIGSSGSDVTALQQFLVARGFLTMPAGVAYGYFGQLTKSALSAYQASSGISPASGYFGPITRAQVGSTGSVTTPTTPVVVGCPAGFTCSPTGSTGTVVGGGEEGQLIEIDNANDVESSLDEGDEENVFGVEFEAEDSDMTIERVDVDFTLADADTTQSDDLEDYITEVSIVLDGETLATLDVDEADSNDAGDGDFSSSADENDVFSFRFTGLNAMVSEGSQAELYVVVKAVNNVDSDDENGTWHVLIPDNGIRAIDSAGLSETYVSSSDLTEETFDVGEAAGGDISVTFESSDNNSATVSVSEDTDTEDVEVLTFSLESDTSDNVIESINIDFSTTTGQVALDDVIQIVRLFADGDEIASEDITNGASDVGGTVTFNDLDLDINEDDEVEFVVKVDIREQGDSQANYANGYAFAATLDRSAIEAEDANGDSVTVSGSDDVGGTMTLRSTGISVVVSDDEDPSATILTNVSDTAADDQGKFEIEFTVSAFEDPAYVELGAVTRGTTESNTGANFILEDSTGTATTSGSVTGSILSRVSGGSTSGNFIKVNDGESATFLLTVYLDADVDAESFRAQLYSVNFASTATDADTQEVAVPAENFETPYVQIQN